MSEDGQSWHFYRHSGLLVRSQLELPEWEAFAAEGGAIEADVSIYCGEPTEEPIEERLPSGDAEHISFSVADTARWTIQDGTEIRIEPAENADPRALRLFTLGSAWGALGYQRRFAMMHGSAVMLGGGAVLFGGTQEQGKSTMAAAMLSRGAKLVSDDLARVDAGEKGGATVHPSSKRIKLWQAAIDRFGLQDSVIAQDLFREEKFHCSAGEMVGLEPVPLLAIVLLEWGDELALEPVTGGDAVCAMLRDTCYRPEMLEIMGRSGEQAALVSQIVSVTPVFRLTRPRDFSRIDEVCALVETRLGS